MAAFRQGPDDFSSSAYTRAAHDKLHGGLLVEGFDEESCRSQYQSATYRRNTGRRPSGHLVSKLRRHEALQRRCGPGTAAYRDALEQLKSGRNAAAAPPPPECMYLVSISYRGLGNRLLAAASPFLYPAAPSSSTPAPRRIRCSASPLRQNAGERRAQAGRGERFAGGSRGHAGAGVRGHPPRLQVYNQTDHDKLFFCDEDQRLLSSFQWLVLRTDGYIVPGLFLLETFREELDALFPERDAVFHHLGRYLFHPANHVWGLVTRYYRAHLAWAQRRVGIQVRVFPWEPDSPELLGRITRCTQEEGLLPRVVDTEEPAAVTADPAGRGVKSSAVLITSLKAWYYEQVKGMYWENAAAGGEVVVVGQPSHEEYQRYGMRSHEYKAWAEIFLLSLTDMLVTAGKSTFGYVAHGLAGMRPWVLLLNQANGTAGHGRPCSRGVSMEPCFHTAPPYDCKRRRDSGEIVPRVRHCEDVPTGLKLFDRKEW
ncbi:hypothetical protein PVAP13_4NG120338 [Panicum virgatum]|uniref:Fucosyltransferase n=1 Tax=Panicum virgatum TaxID=38727 RepID=A0A8T0T5T9_PANVG|nr:hypothetical protein PVAP13_4NG120338 [Panicum virgatum]